MRVTLNLASRPFVELRPLLARLRMAAGVLAVLILVLWLTLHRLEKKAALADTNVSHWTHQTHALEQEWESDQAMMREPENAATLEKSDFLNDLFARKAFSWTAALMDMENVLPGGVQVISMQPQMTKSGHVLLRLQVTGEREKAVELVKNLELSKHFLHPRLAGEAAAQATTQGNSRAGFAPPPVSASSDVNFDILAEYNPQVMDDAPSARRLKSGANVEGEGDQSGKAGEKSATAGAKSSATGAKNTGAKNQRRLRRGMAYSNGSPSSGPNGGSNSSQNSGRGTP